MTLRKRHLYLRKESWTTCIFCLLPVSTSYQDLRIFQDSRDGGTTPVMGVHALKVIQIEGGYVSEQSYMLKKTIAPL